VGERALITKRTARWSKFAALAAGVLALAAVTISPSYAANDTDVYIVQGLPGKNLDVEIDGKSVASGVKTAEVAGPFKVKPGKNTVTFSENGSEILKRTFSVKNGGKADVVAHLPASSSGDPLVTVYKYDDVKLPKGKAFLAVSHTAAVPPADVRVDGQVLFANIANGQSDGQGWGHQPRLCPGRPGKEDHERRRARRGSRQDRVRQAFRGEHWNRWSGRR
jgi:Domain of unknown function (DUF4397)